MESKCKWSKVDSSQGHKATIAFLIGTIAYVAVFASQPQILATILAEHSPTMVKLMGTMALVDDLAHSPSSTLAYTVAQLEYVIAQVALIFFLATGAIGIVTVWLDFCERMRKLGNSIIDGM